MVLDDIDKRLNIKDFELGKELLPPIRGTSDPSTIDKEAGDFCIEIDFEKGSGSPSRVFRAMSDLIDALQTVDQGLVRSIDTKIEPVLLLENIEAGSVRAWLKQAIESVDDEGLKKGDWKIVVGSYLVKAKQLMIKFLEEKTDIKGEEEIAALERDLLILAESTDIKHFPAYEPISRPKLVLGIQRINSALEPLNDTDKALFITKTGSVGFNLSLHIAPETIEELITSEAIQSTAVMILKVKKPDFLGESQWEFRHDNRTILAKMLDTDWLKAFQNGEVPVRPGDAIRAKLLTEVRYGFDREVVATHYVVVQVIEVIPKDDNRQAKLFEPPKTPPLPEQRKF